ncbi:hypothetical protein L9F63_006724, partial [Diploptera punctata]
QLLTEEYSTMSPGTLEAQGLINQAEYQKVAALTQSASPDAHKKIADFFGRVKDKAGDLERTLKEKDRHGIVVRVRIAQLLLSLLHAWGMDPDLDRVCEGKLGLLRPMVPVSFGVLSKGGYMSLLLPTWQAKLELVRLERLTRLFTARTHWELSTTLTSNHLLAIIAMANTLMSMNNATFVPEQERTRKLHRQTQQAQIKQGWSLLATLHCVLLPDKVIQAGSKSFKRPQVEMMARRWQHQCLEVREAAQALLLAELGRLGPKGRKALVDSWAQFPTIIQFFRFSGISSDKAALLSSNQQELVGQQGGNGSATGHQTEHPHHEDEDDEEEEGTEEYYVRKPWSVAELKRKQTTAVVLLGVIGAEFGQDVTDSSRRRASEDQRRKSSVVEGFGIGNNNLARLTSLALTHLLSAPPSARLPAHTPLRRAAIDLIGRGFTVWEPYLDVSKVLLGLLELCCEADNLVPSMTYGLPLTPAADSCRTARHALTLIATARPAAFITTMAREVARYNTLQQNAQALNVNLSNSVLHRAKPEILRGVELLIDKMQNEMADLLVEVVDIVLHCLDPGHLKTRGLGDVFPAVCRFNQVSHCPSTRRIAVGAKNGQVALYELRSQKCQMIGAHNAAITANTFSPDGKYLATYSCNENRLSFWQ